MIKLDRHWLHLDESQYKQYHEIMNCFEKDKDYFIFHPADQLYNIFVGMHTTTTIGIEFLNKDLKNMLFLALNL